MKIIITAQQLKEIKREINRISKLKSIGCPGDIVNLVNRKTELDAEEAVKVFSELVAYFNIKDIEWQDRCRVDVPLVIWNAIAQSISGCDENRIDDLCAVLVDPNISVEKKVDAYNDLAGGSLTR